MNTILARLNKKLGRLYESVGPSWKNPHSGDYDRQVAEDALYHTIGPLLDAPRWVETDWHAKLSGNPPPPEFKPGGPAPQWTTEEVTFAMGGDPKLLGRARDNPKSPLYPPKSGGSPIWRKVKMLASIYGREKDRAFIQDLYMNGQLQLAKMMQPGMDEGRSAFIPYVMKSIESAMGHGTGGGREESRAAGESSEYFTNELGQMRDRVPSGSELNPRTKAPKGWKRFSVVGIKKILTMKKAEPVRKAAEIVQGKFQTTRSHDKHPDNPFGPFSPAYYRVVNQYADALDTKDPDKIEAAKSQLMQLMEEIDDAAIQIRGASTGLGQAISTKDRAKNPKKEVAKRLAQMEVNGKSETIYDTVISKIGDDEFAYQYRDARGAEKFQALSGAEVIDALATRQGLGIQSMDVPDEEGGGSAAGNIEEVTEELGVEPEAVEYVLEIAMKTDLGAFLNGLPRAKAKYHAMAMEMSCKTNKNTGEPVIGGKMSPQELRFTIRYLGNMGQHYYGKDKVRKNLQIPRDGKGWITAGEDPEIEPLPKVASEGVELPTPDGGVTSGGLWHSWWKSNDFPRMGPVEIAEEMTIEAKKFHQLGIPSERSQRCMAGKPALSKVAAGNTAKAGKIKMKILSDIHKGNLGHELDESVAARIPLLESVKSLAPIDREMVVAACEAMIRRFDEVIAEIESPVPPKRRFLIKSQKRRPSMHPIDTVFETND